MIDLDQLIREIEFAKAHGKPLIAIAGSHTALGRLAKLVTSDFVPQTSTGSATFPQSFYGLQVHKIDHPERFGIGHDELIQVTSQAELYAVKRLDFMDQIQIDTIRIDLPTLLAIYKNSFESQSAKPFPPEIPLPPFERIKRIGYF